MGGDGLVGPDYLPGSNIMTDQEERDMILEELVPKFGRMDFRIQTHPDNAFVYQDDLGRLCVLKDGMWLGASIEHVQGDQAPFCG